MNALKHNTHIGEISVLMYCYTINKQETLLIFPF